MRGLSHQFNTSVPTEEKEKRSIKSSHVTADETGVDSKDYSWSQGQYRKQRRGRGENDADCRVGVFVSCLCADAHARVALSRYMSRAPITHIYDCQVLPGR